MTNTGSFPFVVKDGSLTPFKTIGASEFFSDFSYGDVISGSAYPLTAKISSDFYLEGQIRPNIVALKNTLNYYKPLSKYYDFEYYRVAPLRVVNIPSIFYGQSIRKGTVSCKWYLSGTLMAELRDEKRNGELIQILPQNTSNLIGSGSVAGIVLYNEGFILLTGSWNLHSQYTDEFNIFDPGVSTYEPTWVRWMGTGSSGVSLTPSSSYALDFDGVEQIPTITMLTHASRGEFNHSNNPTFIEYGQELTPFTSSNAYVERDEITLKNIVHASYNEVEPTFEKTTFISKVGIYDADKNLIAIAKLSTPIRKKESEAVTIKLKLDM